jgi:hypothetical protein
MIPMMMVVARRSGVPALAGNETQGRMTGINQPTQSSERSGAGPRVSIPPWKPGLRQF